MEVIDIIIVVVIIIIIILEGVILYDFEFVEYKYIINEIVLIEWWN